MSDFFQRSSQVPAQVGGYIVRLSGKIAIRFYTNLVGAFHQRVRDMEASRFASEAAARRAAKAHGLTEPFTVELVPPSAAASQEREK